jgi:hypothetical protein
VVTITSPANGDNFDEEASVSFAATAADNEDGDVGASLSWSSSLNGEIGSGTGFSTSVLTAGVHTITAQASDSGGQTGSDQISISVGSAGTVHVASVVANKENVGGGNKRGTAVVTIVDNLGNPAQGHLVTGDFSGDVLDTGVTDTTGADGTAVIVSSPARKVNNVSFCVSGVGPANDLTYNPADNAEGTTCP